MRRPNITPERILFAMGRIVQHDNGDGPTTQELRYAFNHKFPSTKDDLPRIGTLVQRLREWGYVVDVRKRCPTCHGALTRGIPNQPLVPTSKGRKFYWKEIGL